MNQYFSVVTGKGGVLCGVRAFCWSESLTYVSVRLSLCFRGPRTYPTEESGTVKFPSLSSRIHDQRVSLWTSFH